MNCSKASKHITLPVLITAYYYGINLFQGFQYNISLNFQETKNNFKFTNYVIIYIFLTVIFGISIIQR